MRKGRSKKRTIEWTRGKRVKGGASAPRIIKHLRYKLRTSVWWRRRSRNNVNMTESKTSYSTVTEWSGRDYDYRVCEVRQQQLQQML